VKIWHSTYQLSLKGPANSHAKAKFRKGALLRVRFNDKNLIGFADLCPFSEMGDQPLELELKHLVQMKPSDIGARSLHFARIDALARAEGKSVYDSKVRIKNHFLVNDLMKFETSRLKKIEADGFSEMKIKLGRDLQIETERLEQICKQASSQLKFRLDFNSSLSRERFVNWFEKHQSWLRPKIEFFEDAFAYDAREWREVSERWNLTLAMDFVAPEAKLKSEGAAVIIVKPAVEDETRIIKSVHNQKKKFVFTHYMDFPVGQMAAYQAAQSASAELGERLMSCGLQHHDLYEGLTFQNEIKSDGPYVLPPEGNGFGFDRLFENLKWVELN